MATLETQFKNFLQENPDVNPTFDEWVKLKFSKNTKDSDIVDVPCNFDHNGECLICDCTLDYCAYQRYLIKDYKYETKEELNNMFGKPKNDYQKYVKMRNETQDEFGYKKCYCGHTDYCECANPDETLFNESVNRGCINDDISDWDVTLMDGLGDEPYEREIKSYDELKKHFKITLNHLLLDKESQNDEEIIDFYINVFCDMTESYATHKNNELYSEIEHLIIQWNIDGTKTAGSLTREIMKLL